MKQMTSFAMAACMLLCTSCGAVTAPAEHAAFQELTGTYFDTSDISPDGTFEQFVCGGTDAEGENSLVKLVFDQYRSPDGEVYTFDAKGRLCYYRNVDDLFYNRMHGTTEKRTQEEMQETAGEILQCCGLDMAEFETTSESYFPDTGESAAYSLGLRRVHSEGIAVAVILKLTDDGQLRSLNINYNETPEPTPEQKAYFAEQLDAYTARKQERYDLVGYTYETMYYQYEDQLYASYTFTFAEAPAEEPAYFTDEVTFMTQAG
ncbi:MAG: hypothetical protein IJV04_01125 [Lachnospiraceae bacterium]|nr:hypothetical protein [Lachnospiraceae bacterium]